MSDILTELVPYNSPDLVYLNPAFRPCGANTTMDELRETLKGVLKAYIDASNPASVKAAATTLYSNLLIPFQIRVRRN